MNYKKNLISGKDKIAVWGTGYIGLSTMAFFSKKRISCVGFDVDKKVKCKFGKLPIKELKSWFGFDIKNSVKSNKLLATNDRKYFLINLSKFTLLRYLQKKMENHISKFCLMFLIK